jgi:glucose-1-phosphate adenylyltransferase
VAAAALVDIDAVPLALANDAASGALNPSTAQRAIALAVLVNTGVKAVLAAALGGIPMLRSTTAVLAAALLAAAITAAATLGGSPHALRLRHVSADASAATDTNCAANTYGHHRGSQRRVQAGVAWRRGSKMAVTDNPADRTVAVVLAGGKGTRLDPLTRNVCKPALPFGGAFRCIDFSLSNCVNSGVRTVGVATQYKPDSLLAHLRAHWNSAAVGNRTAIRAWRAEERAGLFGYSGTADAVYRNLGAIKDLEHSLVLILAGDHVYQADYRPMLEAHCARQATVTIGCGAAAIEEAPHLGVLAVAGDGRVEHFVEKPQSPAQIPHTSDGTVLVSTGIYVFDGRFLARVLAADAALPDSGHDFGTDILPRLIEGGRAFSHAFSGLDGAARAYWRDVGTLSAFWRAHMDLLGATPLLRLDDPRWPLGSVNAAPRVSQSVMTAGAGTIENSIAHTGCTIAGDVSRCVLFDGVEVGRGAEVSDSVVLPGAVIGAGSRLRGVIVDEAYRVPEGTVIEPRGDMAEPAVLSEHYDRAARYAVGR